MDHPQFSKPRAVILKMFTSSPKKLDPEQADGCRPLAKMVGRPVVGCLQSLTHPTPAPQRILASSSRAGASSSREGLRDEGPQLEGLKK